MAGRQASRPEKITAPGETRVFLDIQTLITAMINRQAGGRRNKGEPGKTLLPKEIEKKALQSNIPRRQTVAQTIRTIPEPNKTVNVVRECDVVVVGGGPGGIGAAVAAARNGADTVLIERYGLPRRHGHRRPRDHHSVPVRFQRCTCRSAGLPRNGSKGCRSREAEIDPPREIWGSTDKRFDLVLERRSFFTVREGRIVYASLIDAEISKFILNEMVNEARMKTYLHSWGTMPIMDGDKAVGVVLESKSGRQAVMAKVVIDSTGDGDLCPYARRNSTRTSIRIFASPTSPSATGSTTSIS